MTHSLAEVMICPRWLHGAQRVSLLCNGCRSIAVFLKRFNIPTDFVALLDEWAARFFEELDYVHEVWLPPPLLQSCASSTS